MLRASRPSPCRIRWRLAPPPWGGFPRSIARQPRECQNTERYVFGKLSARCFPTPNFFGTDTTLTGLWRYRAWKIGLRVCDIPAGVRCSSSVTSILQQQGLRVADGKNLHVLFSTRFSSETSCPYCCTHCLPLCAARLGSSGFKVVRARYQYSMKLSAINCQGGCSCSHYMSQ